MSDEQMRLIQWHGFPYTLESIVVRNERHASWIASALASAAISVSQLRELADRLAPIEGAASPRSEQVLASLVTEILQDARLEIQDAVLGPSASDSVSFHDEARHAGEDPDEITDSIRAALDSIASIDLPATRSDLFSLLDRLDGIARGRSAEGLHLTGRHTALLQTLESSTAPMIQEEIAAANDHVRGLASRSSVGRVLRELESEGLVRRGSERSGYRITLEGRQRLSEAE